MHAPCILGWKKRACRTKPAQMYNIVLRRRVHWYGVMGVEVTSLTWCAPPSQLQPCLPIAYHSDPASSADTRHRLHPPRCSPCVGTTATNNNGQNNSKISIFSSLVKIPGQNSHCPRCKISQSNRKNTTIYTYSYI